MKTIGVTGGIASGKSAVCRILEDFAHIDADQISRQVVAPGQPGLENVVKAFGSEVLTPQGTLDRARVRRIIATSEQAQRRLNAILHPLIRAEIRRQRAELATGGEKVVFISAALMLETGSFREYDAVILVTAPFEVRLKRLLARDGMDETTARSLMAKQWPDEKKRPYATVEIVNDADLETLAQRTWDALETLGISIT